MYVFYLYFLWLLPYSIFRRRVVCPLALVGQWADEIEKMTNLRVLKHQGTSRTTGKMASSFILYYSSLISYQDPAVLQKYHVVVTTYDTVKSEYVSHSPSAKDESKKSKVSKAKAADLDDDDDSESDSFEKAKKSRSKAGSKKCALFVVKWWRLVLGTFFKHILKARVL